MDAHSHSGPPGHPSVTRQALRGAWLLGTCALLAGCSLPARPKALLAAAYEPDNVFCYLPGLPADVKRVAVLPLACESQRNDLADGCDALSAVLAAEVIKTKKFETVPVDADVLRYRTGTRNWTGQESLPPDFFSSLQEIYQCDAVLFCQLTVFRAYAPLAVGWRMKLVDARTRQTLWAVDEVFDAGKPGVLKAAERYQSAELQTSTSTPSGWLIENSPRRFGQYTVAQLLAALPAR